MSNPTGNKLEKLVFGMFDQMVEGADKYVTKQESTWLIFTEDKRWVIEFTKDKTLWFNYNLFQSEFELIGKDCTEERDLIKKWFELRFLNTPKVKDTRRMGMDIPKSVEDDIQNGVKYSFPFVGKPFDEVNGIIQNGVKETNPTNFAAVDEAIQNGVKDTRSYSDRDKKIVGDIIQSGVKEIKSDEKYIEHFTQTYKSGRIIETGVKETYESKSTKSISLRHAIQNGVKETKEMEHDRNSYHGHFILEDDIPTHIPMDQVQDVIENGVIQTQPMSEWVNSKNIVSEVIDVGVNVGVKKIGHKKTPDESFTNHIIEEGVKEIKEVSNFNLMSEIFKVNAKKAIIDGVKELKELPDKSGELRGYGDWYQRQGNMAKPHTEYVKEVIEDHYNHMGRVEGIIKNTDKDGI